MLGDPIVTSGGQPDGRGAAPCASGAWLRWVRRAVMPSKELVLEITEQSSDGRRIERRLVLEKQ